MPDDPIWIIKAILIPAVVAAGIGIIVRAAVKREFGWALGIGIAFALSYTIGIRIPDVPPIQVEDWLPVIVVPGLLIIVILASLCVSGRSVIVPWIVKVVLCCAIPWLILRSRTSENIMLPEDLWSTGKLAAWIVGFALMALAGDVSLFLMGSQANKDESRRTRANIWLWLIMGIACGATGLTHVYSYNLTGGQHGMVLAGITIGVAFIAFGVGIFLKPSENHDSLLPETVWLILTTILLLGFVYNSKMHWQNVAILATAPHIAWIGELPWIRKTSGWLNAGIRIVIVSLILALAVIPTASAYLEAQKTEAEQTEENGEDDIYQYYE